MSYSLLTYERLFTTGKSNLQEKPRKGAFLLLRNALYLPARSLSEGGELKHERAKTVFIPDL